MTVCAPGGRLDVALPKDVPLHVGLGAMGLRADGLTTLVLDSDGQRLDLTSLVGDVLEDGEVLAVVAASGAIPGAPTTGRRPRGADPVAGRRADRIGLVVAAGLAVAAVAGWLVTDSWPGPWRGHTLVLALAALTAAAVGVLVSTAGPARWRPVAWPVTATVCVLAAGWTVAAVAGWPAAVVAAAAGFGPLALRMSPGIALKVPVEQLVDVAANATAKWTVRGSMTGAPRPIRTAAVDHLMRTAELRLRSTAICVCAATVALTPALLGAWPRGGNLSFLAPVAGSLAAVGLALVPRSATDRLVRRAARYASAAVAIEVVVAVGSRLSLGPATAAAGFGLAAVLFGASMLASRGVRSVGLSRLGDWLEALALVLAPACALVGAGWLDLLRASVS
ncbi:MAG: hypothetical protein LBK95_05090 [Bifidobacteriaceae bacterium]|nr:hypothetical protein [Bifidobacteriaceae bacterium]